MGNIEASYTVSGMTCDSCVEKITARLKEDPKIHEVRLRRSDGKLEIQSDYRFAAADLHEKLRSLGKYTVSDGEVRSEALSAALKTYYPLLLVFALTLGVPFLALLISGRELAGWMPLAMGSSLVAIAFFKLLDLPKFAEGFSTYDPLARRLAFYGWLYPFLEAGAGVLFLSGRGLMAAAAVTAVILTVTTAGVISALRQKRTIQCACLGTIFNLPLTKVTIAENAVMITMALSMLFYR